MKSQKVSHIAVWICVVLNQIVSIIWYSPLLFASKWMNYLGKSFGDFDGESVTGLFFSITGAISINYFLSWLFIKLQIDNVLKSLSIALFLALFCFSFPTLTQDSFSLRPIGLSLINSGNILLNFCISGITIGGWRTYNLSKIKI